MGKARAIHQAAAAHDRQAGPRCPPRRSAAARSRTAGEVSELVSRRHRTPDHKPAAGRAAQRRGWPGAKSLLKAVAVSPQTTKHFGAPTWASCAVVSGQSTAAPTKDRRFADPAWKGSFVYRRLIRKLRGRRGPVHSSSTTDLDARDKGACAVLRRWSRRYWRPATGCSPTLRRCARSSTPAARTVAGLKNRGARHPLQQHAAVARVDSAFKVGENGDLARAGGAPRRDIRADPVPRRARRRLCAAAGDSEPTAGQQVLPVDLSPKNRSSGSSTRACRCSSSLAQPAARKEPGAWTTARDGAGRGRWRVARQITKTPTSTCGARARAA